MAYRPAHNEAHKRYIEKLKKKGLCLWCATRPVVTKQYCEICRVKKQKKSKEDRKKYKACWKSIGIPVREEWRMKK